MRIHYFVLWIECFPLVGHCDRRQLDSRHFQRSFWAIPIRDGNRFSGPSRTMPILRHFWWCNSSGFPPNWAANVPLCSKANPVLSTPVCWGCEFLPFSRQLCMIFSDRWVHLWLMPVPACNRVNRKELFRKFEKEFNFKKNEIFSYESMVLIGSNANKFRCNNEFISLNCGGEMWHEALSRFIVVVKATAASSAAVKPSERNCCMFEANRALSKRFNWSIIVISIDWFKCSEL